MYVIGQRWISTSEPELGLGTIAQIGDGRVQVEFAAANETRIYNVEQAPLQRVRFRIGEKIRSQTGLDFIVKEVREQQGLLV